MSRRDDRIYKEAVALWRQVYGESPPRGMDGGLMLEQIMSGLPQAQYARFATRHLRASNITFPRPGPE